MKNLIESKKNTLIGVLFGFLLFGLVLINLNFRKNHYQEIDSYISYAMMEDGIRLLPGYLSNSYHSAPSVFTVSVKTLLDHTPEWVISILDKGEIKTSLLRKTRLENKVGLRELITIAVEKKIITENINIHAAYRSLLATLIEHSAAPELVKRAMIYPLATTFSIGPGLIYSVIYQWIREYEDFKNSVLFITLAFHYIACLSLFFVFKEIKLAPIVTISIPLWYSLSLSNVSYAMHMGCYGWNTATVTILTGLAMVLVKKDRIEIAYYASAIGMLFSYMSILIFFPMLAYILYARLVGRNGLSLPSVGRIYFTAILVLVYLILFFQPGQGTKVPSAPDRWVIDYPYFIVLNIFSVFNLNLNLLKTVQLIIPLMLIFMYFSGVARIGKFLGKEYFIPFIVLLIYLILWTFGLLNPIPSRHVLFLSGPLYIICGIGMSFSLARINSNLCKIGIYIITGVFIITALLYIPIRQMQVNSVYPAKYFTTSTIWVPETGLPFLWMFGDVHRSVKGRNIGITDGDYLYVSESRSLDDFLDKCDIKKTDNCPANIKQLESLDTLSLSNPHGNLAYPYLPNSEQFPFNATQKLFLSKISFR